MQRISEIHRELFWEELTAGIRKLRARIREYQEEYSASDSDDLAFQLESDTDDSWDAVTEWWAAENDLEIAKAALALYNFDPDAAGGTETNSNATERGSFAGGALDASV